jgi:hypothetical protein
MTTLVIEENSVQARQFVKYVRTLPFVTIKKSAAVAKPQPEEEEEFNLYDSLNRAFAEVKLMKDGKMPKQSIDEFIEELRTERENELQYHTD